MSRAAAIIAAHPDPEMAQLRAEVERLKSKERFLRAVNDGLADECNYLSGEHNRGSEIEQLPQLRARVAQLELQTFDIKKLEADKERLYKALLAARSALVSCRDHWGEGPPNVSGDIAAIDAAKGGQP